MSQESAKLDEELLWDSFASTSDGCARDKLIELYSPFVRMLAASLYSQRHDEEIEFDDYYQFGMIGLIESIDRYRHDAGAHFKTFATYRIRGSILNGLVKLSERREQSSYRSRLKKERLASLVDNEKKDNDLFSEMVEVALGLAICYMLEDTGLVQDPSRGTKVQEQAAGELSLLRSRLVESIETLPERERLIVEYHYFKHICFGDLADVLGVTKGRVSQIHKRALLMLRERLGSASLDECF